MVKKITFTLQFSYIVSNNESPKTPEQLQALKSRIEKKFANYTTDDYFGDIGCNHCYIETKLTNLEIQKINWTHNDIH
jgi:hypothetical protein